MLERSVNWMDRHKYLTGVLCIATAVVVLKTWQSTCPKKRRARRARSGGRLDVVVIAGSPTLPLTRSLALDMERKGCVVFVVCNSTEDELTLQGLARSDIHPLSMDITDPPAAGAAIDRFAHVLQSAQAPVPGVARHRLQLKAVVLIPSLNYLTSPIATIPPSAFADLFNTHLLHPILTVQSFLPLLAAQLTQSRDPKDPAKVVVLTPSVMSAINPPFHAPEATVCSALTAFTEVLAAELGPLNIPVTHIQLGTFEAAGRAHPLVTAAEAGSWPEPARHAYAKNYLRHQNSLCLPFSRRFLRGTPLRELHNAVFDVIYGSDTRAVVRVGLGANVYGFVGRWLPRGLVGWMMGVRRVGVEQLALWQGGEGRRTPDGSASCGASGSRGGSEGGEVGEYVAVGADDEHHEHHVWNDV